MRRTFTFDNALLPSGWARDVHVTVGDGVIVDVAAGGRGEIGERISGVALPGLPNLHCHAFQRGLPGLAERRVPGDDRFWTWREAMYRSLALLSPDDRLAIAAF